VVWRHGKINGSSSDVEAPRRPPDQCVARSFVRVGSREGDDFTVLAARGLLRRVVGALNRHMFEPVRGKDSSDLRANGFPDALPVGVSVDP